MAGKLRHQKPYVGHFPFFLCLELWGRQVASGPPCWTLWGCALEGSFSRSVGGGEAGEAGQEAAGVPWSPPRSKAECHRKVASSAIALQSDGNTPQSPEVKGHLPGEEETLVVSRD